MRSSGITAERAVAALAGENEDNLTAEHSAATRHSLQAELRRDLARREPERVHFRFRHELSYWIMPGFPRILAERFPTARSPVAAPAFGAAAGDRGHFSDRIEW
eukprot:9320416-Pyramimonas_sp.AAC.1